MASEPQGNDALKTQIRQQEVVAALGQQALETDDLDQLMHDACVTVAETLETEYAKVLELCPGGDDVFLRQGVGWNDGLVGSATVPTDLDSQAGYTLLSEAPIVVEDLRTEDRFSGPDLLTDHDVVSGISVTIGSVDDPWGVLGTHTTDHREFTEHDATFVQSIANVLASAIETTEARRALEREKALKDQIVDTSPVGITVVGSDGQMQFANEFAEDILGRTRTEIETFSHDDPRWGLVDSDGESLSGGETPFEQVLQTGQPVFDMEIGLLRPSGERIWIMVNGAPLDTDVDGDDPSHAVFSLTDVTEQKRLETEFEEMVGRISDAFYAVDDEFRFTHVNERAAELLQRPAEKLIGEKLWTMYPEAAEVEEVWEAFHTALNEQEQTSYELYFDPLDFWVEANLYPSETGVSVYFRDVTERKQREQRLEETNERLEQSNERLEQFAYAASHDLQEPLRMVSSYLQLLERRYEGVLDDDGEEFLAFAVDGADRMRAMIESLLKYSRVDTQGDPLEPVELDAVLTDVLADLQFQIDETEADITAESLPRVEGDGNQLRQLFQNLFDNALTYSGDDPPRIAVTAERSNGQWVVSITDDGVGIAPGDHETVFEVFQRLHSRDEYGGTGIGLALCQRIVERHGGDIWVDSAPGEGSTFLFTLQAVDDAEFEV
ncbi:ATP-binding protein [Natronosalvus vescus]|uniref:ATP-binding protein n=1 Tax=Natronosalvus vescus TaxID=2953881 RepID=UPI002091B2C1|nr:ATP-binding protein [Natronosalvus vescus]